MSEKKISRIMPLKKICLALDLKNDPQLIATYEHFHKDDVIWPEILEGNKKIGIRSMEIYRAGNRLFMIMETAEDFDVKSKFEELATYPRQREWATLMHTFQASLPFAGPNEHWVEMTKIFSQY